MLKLDLHTHSVASPDGGITPNQYLRALQDEKLNCVAITDHNTTELAERLRADWGERIIVGEEIMTTEGEVIGLFLSEEVRPGISALDTVKLIKDQGALVYVPHPFETIRRGLAADTLHKIADYVDIVEVHNARAWAQNRGPQAVTWATLHHKARAAASDAHGAKGLGHSYCLVDEMPTRENLVKLLADHSRLVTGRPPAHTLLYPKLNRVKKKLTRRK